MASRQISIRLSVEDAQKVRDVLRGIGDEGRTALGALETGAAKVAPAMRQVDTAAEQSGRGMQRFSSQIGQAGFQLQDFVVQVSSGQSALVALGQQGSQFLGAFGTGGAIAGAALAVGVLAAQFLGAADAGKALTAAVDAQEKGLQSATAAARQWRDGLQTEAQQVRDLTLYYASLSEARRTMEARAVERDRASLQEQLGSFADEQVGRLRGLPETLATQVRDLEGLANQYPVGSAERQMMLSSSELADLRARADEAKGIVADFTRTVTTDGANTSEALAQVVSQLRQMAEGASAPAARELNRVADAMERAAPRAAELSTASENLNARLEALGLKNIAAANGLDALAAAAGRAQAKLADLQGQAALAAAAPERGLANAQALLRTLETSGTKAAEALQRQQTAAESLDGRVRAQLDTETSRQRAVVQAEAETLRTQGKREEATNLLREAEARIYDERQRREPQVRQQLAETDTANQTYATRRQEIAKREQEAEAAANRARTAARSADRKDASDAAREREAQMRVEAELYTELTKTRSGLLSIGTMDDRVIQQIQTSIRGTALDPDKRKKDEEDATKAFQATYEKQQREAERTYDRIADYAGDRFADLFLSTEGGWAKTMDNVRRTAIATFARIAAEALLRPIIMPVVQALTGSGGVAGAAAGVAGVPGAAGTTASSGYMDYAKQASSIFSGSTYGANPLTPGYSFSSGFIGKADGYLGTNVGGFLDTPVYSQQAPAFGPYSGADPTAAFTGNANTLTYGQAASGVLSVAGGAYGIYSGIQQGGAKGAANVVSGTAGVVGGAAGLAAGSAGTLGLGAGAAAALGTVAAVAPYVAAIAAVVAMLLPAQKPSDKTGTALVNYSTDTTEIGGLTGDRFSQANRDFAKQIGDSLQQVADRIGTAYGINAGGKMLVSAGDRDGIVLRNASENYRFEADEDGVKQLISKATSIILEENRGQLTGDLATVANTVGTGDPDKLLAALDWTATTYKALTATAEEASASSSSFAQSLKALREPWDEAIEKATSLGLATQGLAEAQLLATNTAIKARNDAFNTELLGMQVQAAQMMGGDLTGIALRQFDQNRTTQWEQMVASIRDRGLGDTQINDARAAFDPLQDLQRQQLEQQYRRAFQDSQNASASLTAADRSRALRLAGDTTGADVEDYRARRVVEEVAYARQLEDLRFSTETAADMLRRFAQETESGAAQIVKAAEEQAAATAAATAAEQAATAAAQRDSAAGSAASAVASLSAYARSLTTSDAAAGTVLDRLASAREIYEATSRAAAGGDAEAIGRFQGDAETLRGLARQTFGGGAGYAEVMQTISAGLSSIADRGPDALTQDFMRENMRQPLDRIGDEVAALRAENANFRRDLSLMMALIK